MTVNAQAQVETDKAARYLKALCNHFSRKVTATYEGNHGDVKFGFGDCQMDASETALTIRVQAENDEQLTRAKTVVADHLMRFAGDESLEVSWTDQA